jgi:hypothetical protein
MVDATRLLLTSAISPESNVLAHNVAGFIEALAECINHVRENLGLPAA